MNDIDGVPSSGRRRTAVIIGAGFGGLAAAVRLGAKGWDCVLLDKLDTPGGRATAHREAGQRFDLGPTIVTTPHLFADLRTLAGKRMEDDIDLRPMLPFDTIKFQHGTSFSASGDTEAMEAEVTELSPDDLPGYRKFLADGRRRHGVGFENHGRRPMHDFWDFLKTLPTFAWLRADRSVHGLAARRVKDPRLRMALSFHLLFIGAIRSASPRSIRWWRSLRRPGACTA